MTKLAGPLYEATFLVPPERAAEFSAWLQELQGNSLQQPGIVDVRVWNAEGEDDEKVTICQFRCRDDNAVDGLLDTYFADIDLAVAQAFDDSVEVSGRCLRQDDSQDVAVSGSPDCLNCGTRLSGQYCGSCGQRAQSRLISLWQLVAEAFGDLFEFDSRLWRTIIPLLARPGQLTHDYLLGRRARYMPPFRSYLVLSVIFFVVAFFDPRDDLGLLFEPVPEPAPEQVAEQQAEAVDEEDDGLEVQFTASDEVIDENCRITDASVADLPGWLKVRLTPERLQQVCERIVADKGAAFVDLLLDNIPVALIVLLPLMALVLKILYPLSRRYFVEHLLFFVHFHAFFFLILTLEILFSRIGLLVGLPELLITLTLVAASLYVPVYLYKAMRRVYGQGHILTGLKYLALVAAYVAGLSLMMISAVLFALVAV